MRSRSERAKKSRGITKQEKNKGLLESLTKCKKMNLAIYPVVLTSRLVSNAYLKVIMMKITIVVRLKTFRFLFDSLFPSGSSVIKTWFLRNLLPESGVPNGKKMQ